MNEVPGEIIPIENEPETIVETNLTGIVTGRDKTPIVDANVSVAGEMVQTDENGIYRLLNIDLSNDGTLIKVEKEGYFNAFQFVNGEPGENSYLETAMVLKEAKSFDSTSESTVNVGGGSSVTFKANSITQANGQDYQGEVIVYTHWYDPSSPELASTMPGDLRGRDLNNQNVQLLTYGMMAVELESPNGEELQLAENTTATLTFPIVTGSNATDYTSIPMWHLDEDSGIWLEEGSANVETDRITAEVSHFSFWNCDFPLPLVNLKGILVNSDGEPLPYQTLVIKANVFNAVQNGITNQSGAFSGKVPQGVELSLFIYDCGELTEIRTLGILDVDTDLENVVADNFSGVNIKGQLLDCMSQPVIDGYAILSTDSRDVVLLPDDNGMIDYYFFSCNETVGTITAYDITNSKVSDPITVDLGDDIKLMTVTICDDTQNQGYLRFSVDGGTTYHVLNDVDVTLVDLWNQGIYFIHAYVDDHPSGIPIYFMLKHDVISGTYTYKIQGIRSNGNPREFEGDRIENLANVYEVGDEINHDFSDGLLIFELRLFVDRVVSSGIIRGSVWHDENANGIREPGELPLSGKEITLVQSDFDLLSPTYYPDRYTNKRSSISDEDGNYILDGVIVDEGFYLSYESASQEQVSPANATGDDTLDSDFSFLPSSQRTYQTEVFSVLEGDEITGYDLGIQPDTLRCITEYLCCPTKGMAIYTLGGIGPFDVLLTDPSGATIYDQQFTSSPIELILDTDVIFDLELEDSVGDKCEMEIFVPTYLNGLFGNVWVDDPSGTSNERDNLDMDYEGLVINMIDEDDNIVKTTTSEADGRYSFSSFEGGTYRIQVDLPAGYEFLVLGDTSEQEKSHIIQSTGKSLEHQIDGWDWDIVYILNVGLKQL